MSGHSKWSKVKHQKEDSDKIKGKIFTKLANAIITAIRQGGGNADPNFNFKLRLIIDKARRYNMPKDNIERAVKRAKGASSDVNIEDVVYEAFGPGGVGLIIEATTDNKLRTVSVLKNILTRHGGILVESGGVSHLFRYVGLITLDKNSMNFDKIMDEAINLGAIDITEGECVSIITHSKDTHRIKMALEKIGLIIQSIELIYQPLSGSIINNDKINNSIKVLIDALEEDDDVQKVFVNYNLAQ